jgi:ketosteroid isomerase-like protein
VAAYDDAILDTFSRYVRAFESLRPEAVVPYYHQPCLFISPQGVVALPTGADVAGFFQKVMADLRTSGYVSSAFPDLEVLRLSDSLAAVRGLGIWKKADGTDLRRFGLTYTLRKSDAEWRIVVAVAHDPPP